MYSKTGVLQDRREMLKVKAKSLVAEVAIIRTEEKRTHGELKAELQWHRRSAVRDEARATYMAYGLIRGRAVDRIEKPGSVRTDNMWKRVKIMVARYGPCDKAANAELVERCKS